MKSDKLDSLTDYRNSGLTIQQAILAHVKKYPKKENRPNGIIWGQYCVKTSDILSVGREGVINVEVVSSKKELPQGFDIKVDGHFLFAGGEKVPLIRTWIDEEYEDVVTYPFFSPSGTIFFWNVYKMDYPNGDIIEEKWTGNAGFWVEEISENVRIYHCSPGSASVPDFEAMVLRLTISRRLDLD